MSTVSSKASKGKPSYEFQEAYRSSPVLFAQEVLGITSLWTKQKEVLDALGRHARVAVKSGNGLGKGFSAAISILWFLYCADEAVVLSTAPTFRQVRHVLWKEVHRLCQRARYRLDGKLLDTRLEISKSQVRPGTFLRIAPTSSRGSMGPTCLLWWTRRKGVEETIYEAIESVMTSENCKLLLIGNPTTDGRKLQDGHFTKIGRCTTQSPSRPLKAPTYWRDARLSVASRPGNG